LRADYYDTTTGNNPYLVMQYCPENVGDKAGQFTEAEIWKFIKDVASGLAYLHENDIIHRDIKPDNILKDSMGNYVITDFGLSMKMRSTLRKASARYNNASDQSGTVGYMAPEMFTSKPNAVKATDIWALGATIYELITGEMPFCGQGGVMELHGAELPELPAQYSQKLKDLIAKCLAKETWDRPTAQSLVTESTEPSKEKTDTTKVVKSSSKRWIYSTIFMTAAVIIGAIFYIDLYQRNEWNHQQYLSCEQKYHTLSYANNIVSEEKEKLTKATEYLMGDFSVKACDIKIKNEGQGYGEKIYSSQTTYIYTSFTLISKVDIWVNKLSIKFYSPNGLSTGTSSSNGYSYHVDINSQVKKFEPCVCTDHGWGNSTKGNWRAGNYRVEIYFGDRCIGTKYFKIY
jgi:serine/threonine protein kinase